MKHFTEFFSNGWYLDFGHSIGNIFMKKSIMETHSVPNHYMKELKKPLEKGKAVTLISYQNSEKWCS